MSPQLYRVHERFSTWQGEGVHMGRPAFFIRLHGCSVQCPWCDSAGTWYPTYVPKDVAQMSALALAEEASISRAPFAVITGGEPTMYDLTQLAGALHGRGLAVHLETSGAFEIKGHIDWITLSPKKWKLPTPYNVQAAHELKFIIENPEDIDYYWREVRARGFGRNVSTIWLHPEWSHREDKVVLNAITEAVKKNDRPFRAGWQMHKNFMPDSLDQRSRPLVPLGGDPSKGY